MANMTSPTIPAQASLAPSGTWRRIGTVTLRMESREGRVSHTGEDMSGCISVEGELTITFVAASTGEVSGTTGASETEIVAATDTSLEALEEQERVDDGAVIAEADDNWK